MSLQFARLIGPYHHLESKSACFHDNHALPTHHCTLPERVQQKEYQTGHQCRF